MAWSLAGQKRSVVLESSSGLRPSSGRWLQAHAAAKPAPFTSRPVAHLVVRAAASNAPEPAPGSSNDGKSSLRKRLEGLAVSFFMPYKNLPPEGQLIPPKEEMCDPDIYNCKTPTYVYETRCSCCSGTGQSRSSSSSSSRHGGRRGSLHTCLMCKGMGYVRRTTARFVPETGGVAGVVEAGDGNGFETLARKQRLPEEERDLIAQQKRQQAAQTPPKRKLRAKPSTSPAPPQGASMPSPAPQAGAGAGNAAGAGQQQQQKPQNTSSNVVPAPGISSSTGAGGSWGSGSPSPVATPASPRE